MHRLAQHLYMVLRRYLPKPQSLQEASVARRSAGFAREKLRLDSVPLESYLT